MLAVEPAPVPDRMAERAGGVFGVGVGRQPGQGRKLCRARRRRLATVAGWPGGRMGRMGLMGLPVGSDQAYGLSLIEQGDGERLADRRTRERRPQVGDGGVHGHGQHGIHAVVGCHLLQALPERAGADRRRGVDRAGDHGCRGQQPGAGGARVSAAERGDLQPVVTARVSGQHAGPARVGDDRDPVAGR